MQDLFARLITALSTGGPDSPDVRQLLAAITQGPSEESARAAEGAVNSWLISRGRDPLPTTPPTTAGGSSSWYLKYLPWMLAVLGIGGTAAGATGTIDLTNINVEQLSLPTVTDRWVLLGILAGIGAIVGTVVSYYRHGGWVLPAWADDHAPNMLVIRSYGFLGDLFYGAIAAITTWLALPSTFGQGADGNLLQWNLIVSAVVAAAGGSTAWSALRGNLIAQRALARSATLPAGTADLAKAILQAPNVADAAMLATGMKIPGRSPAPGAPTPPTAVSRAP